MVLCYHFYNNKYITYEVDNRIVQGDMIEKYGTHKFTVTFKYIDDLEKIRFIFYSLIEELRSPITAFEINLSLKEYLDLIERIFDRTKNISTGN